MQKTGIIKKVKYKESFENKYGTTYCFDLAIESGGEMLIGTINSKSQRYPMAEGAEISVEVTDSPHGRKFKKFNAQYAKSDVQSPPSGNSAYGNKDRLIVTQVVYKAMMGLVQDIEESQLIADVDMIMRVGENKPIEAKPAAIEDPTDYDENVDDGIPF